MAFNDSAEKLLVKAKPEPMASPSGEVCAHTTIDEAFSINAITSSNSVFWMLVERSSNLTPLAFVRNGDRTTDVPRDRLKHLEGRGEEELESDRGRRR